MLPPAGLRGPPATGQLGGGGLAQVISWLPNQLVVSKAHAVAPLQPRFIHHLALRPRHNGRSSAARRKKPCTQLGDSNSAQQDDGCQPVPWQLFDSSAPIICLLLPCAVMGWSQGDEWALAVPLPSGLTDFKCVVVREDGSIAEWEPGANRTIEVSTLDALLQQ